MSHRDLALASIAKMELAPSLLPSEPEIKEFVQILSSAHNKVNEFKQFSDDYNNKGAWAKFWESDDAREKIIASLTVIGELSIVTTKLLALNVAFAQKIDDQTQHLSNASSDICQNQQELKEHSKQLVAVNRVLTFGLEGLHSQVDELKGKRNITLWVSVTALVIAVGSIISRLPIF